MLINQMFICGVLFGVLASVVTGGQYSQELWKLIVSEKSAGRVLGSFVELFPMSAKFYNGDLTVTVDKDLLNDKTCDVNKDITVFGGKGVNIRSSKYPIAIDIQPPTTESNICGLILGNSNSKNPINKIQILWKPKAQMTWDLLSVPTTGEYLFSLENTVDTNKRVILFDPVPASNIRLLIHAGDGANLILSVALIHGCKYPGTIQLSCDDVFEKNAKFSGMFDGVPKSISCPNKCSRTKECIGYKIFSSESQICYVAQQAQGVSGNGNYFIYKIPRVVFFRDQVNPILNHGIYCKKSNDVNQGVTFNRVYYDFAIKESQSQKKV